jgi:hypothetical protein
MQPLNKTLLAPSILLASILVLISSAAPIHAQTATGAPAKKAAPQATSHAELWCSLQGLCKTVVRPGPTITHYTHQCKMSTKPGCLKWGAYAKGLDF